MSMETTTIRIINIKDRDINKSEELNQFYRKLEKRSLAENEEVTAKVAVILKDIRDEGDSAVVRYTKKFDGADFSQSGYRVSQFDLELAFTGLPESLKEILVKAKDNIEEFHKKQLEITWTYERSNGAVLGQKLSPIDSVGVYVPGGTAPLPSSVLMNVIPARIAGVKRIVMCTPPGADGNVPDVVLAAAYLAGVNEVYRAGGAQAIAAMAFGTESIKRVDKITGPGNIYVSVAKRLVFGYCGIDMLAGPSEIAIIADETANASFAAADMLSQAEHDKMASAILITDSMSFASDTASEIDNQIKTLHRSETADLSIKEFGAIIVVNNIEEAKSIIERIAPEHLEICTVNPFEIMNGIKNVGAIFLGNYSPEPLGDYLAGPNHVLPTGGTARFCSPLGVYDFIKRSSIIYYPDSAFKETAGYVSNFARAEGLDAHARAAELRLEINNFDKQSFCGLTNTFFTVDKPEGKSIRELVRNELKDFKPYKVEQSGYKIKLDQNESPYDIPLRVRRAMAYFFSEESIKTGLNEYPDNDSEALLKKLASVWSVNKENVLASSGSDQLIQTIITTFAGRGDSVVMPAPSFGMYRIYTALSGANAVEIPLLEKEAFSYNIAAIIECVNSLKAKVLFICTPNNPTGNIMSEKDIEIILENCKNTIIAVDEAYAEFSGTTSIGLTEKYRNLVVLRTLSKAYGMAGLRCGYCIASSELIYELNKIRPPYNINTITQKMAVLILECEDESRIAISKIVEERDRVCNTLKSKGLYVLKSYSNSLLVKFNKAGKVFEDLKKKSILVRYFGEDHLLSSYLRIGIGTPEQNDIVINTLKELEVF